MTGHKGFFAIFLLAFAVCAFLPMIQGAPQEEGQAGGSGGKLLNFKHFTKLNVIL